MLENVPAYVAAVGSLGTAAFALVDGSKAFWGGVSNSGFSYIKAAVKHLFPPSAKETDRNSPLDLGAVLDTLRANWLNGTVFADQKAIAKSLIKLRLSEDNAEQLAYATGVDTGALNEIAKKIRAGQSLGPQENNEYGRFDLILTALLDEGYQRADQVYRNSAKAWAVLASVILAISGGWVIWAEQHGGDPGGYWASKDLAAALLTGLLATPLAPVSKDLASALSTAVQTMQILRK